MGLKLSIIIPVLNELNIVKGIVNSLKNKLKNPSEVEFIFVDGNSSDGTFEYLQSQNKIKVVQTIGRRSVQMNKGAELAKSEILYFLHCDSIPPNNFDEHIYNAVKNGAHSGCFKMKFDLDHWLLNFSGWLTKFNSNFCRGGDQSLFVSKKVFSQINGFNGSLILFEDNEIIPRLKSKGSFVVIQKNLTTSARLYSKNGVVRLQFIFGYLHFLYRIGKSQDKLIKTYSTYINSQRNYKKP